LAINNMQESVATALGPKTARVRESTIFCTSDQHGECLNIATAASKAPLRNRLERLHDSPRRRLSAGDALRDSNAAICIARKGKRSMTRSKIFDPGNPSQVPNMVLRH
jgi:hypothetical protein